LEDKANGQAITVYIVCSTTLWVGHLSKLVQQEELSDTFGEYGDIISIDLIPPRGCAFICMNRRQDSYKALNKLKNHKMQGKVITVGIKVLFFPYEQ
jgi:RNA-binding protein 16